MLDLKDHFIKALESQPNFSEAHLQLALLYKDEGDHIKTISHFELAISSDLDEIKKIENKGDELMKKIQLQNAKEQFIKAEEKKIHCSMVYYHLSNYYTNQGKNKMALFALKSSVEMNPNLAKAHRDLGIMLIVEDQLDNGRYHLEKAINIDYSDSKSHYSLAKVMIVMKDHSDAEQHFLSALDINPQFVDCMIELALLKMDSNKTEEARKYYKQAKEINHNVKYSKLEKLL